jgi:hypothetical protein
MITKQDFTQMTEDALDWWLAADTDLLQKSCPVSCSHHSFSTCGGSGYVPNITYDTLREAIWAKGWLVSIEDTDDGEQISIYPRQVGTNWAYTIGFVKAEENLRNLHALKVATARSIENELR